MTPICLLSSASNQITRVVRITRHRCRLMNVYQAGNTPDERNGLHLQQYSALRNTSSRWQSYLSPLPLAPHTHSSQRYFKLRNQAPKTSVWPSLTATLYTWRTRLIEISHYPRVALSPPLRRCIQLYGLSPRTWSSLPEWHYNEPVTPISLAKWTDRFWCSYKHIGSSGVLSEESNTFGVVVPLDCSGRHCWQGICWCAVEDLLLVCMKMFLSSVQLGKGGAVDMCVCRGQQETTEHLVRLYHDTPLSMSTSNST